MNHPRLGFLFSPRRICFAYRFMRCYGIGRLKSAKRGFLMALWKQRMAP